MGGLMRYIKMVVAASVALGLTACATNQKLATNNISDSQLSCAEIARQDKEADEILEKAQNNKGVSTANVAAVLLFWPAAVGNYMDADKAEQLVTKRKTVLAGLYEAKKCATAT